MQNDPLLEGLEVYIVGGAVRDSLLGLQCGDRDWVVVGATPQEMLRRGFTPVGVDFPVFLHPQTKEEYALARTERKSGKGYKGFTFYTGVEVTLEQDLARRDLTINAMARGMDGAIIDPYGGMADLKARVLRHVGESFEEDPVRLLRLARFAARFTEFTVAEETIELCRRMVRTGEVSHLVPERVWQEISRGLMSIRPSRMFEVLQLCDALPVIMPGFVFDAVLGKQLDDARSQLAPELCAMYAIAMHRSQDRDQLSVRLRATSECTQWARLLPDVLNAMNAVQQQPRSLHPQSMYALIEMADGIRRKERLQSMLRIAAWMLSSDSTPWQRALDAAVAVNAGEIARPLASQGPAAISAAVRAARLRAVQDVYN